MNNINLKSYELEFEADPLFHKVNVLILNAIGINVCLILT